MGQLLALAILALPLLCSTELFGHQLHSGRGAVIFPSDTHLRALVTCPNHHHAEEGSCGRDMHARLAAHAAVFCAEVSPGRSEADRRCAWAGEEAPPVPGQRAGAPQAGAERAAARRRLRATVEAAYARFVRMEQPLQERLLAYLASKPQARPEAPTH